MYMIFDIRKKDEFKNYIDELKSQGWEEISQKNPKYTYHTKVIKYIILQLKK